MTFSDEQRNELAAPLQRIHVSERTQSGRKLSYIEGWHAIAEANRIFGFDGWTRSLLDLRLVMEREREIGQQKRPGWGVTYIATVRIVVGDVIRDGTGTGHGIDVDLGQAHESAVKEAETDAMKRALMTFGNPFGLALYDKDQKSVVDEWRGPLGRHELKTALRAVENDIMNAPDEASLDNVLKAARHLIAQATHDLPEWIEGDNKDVRGLRPSAEMMRAEFKSREAMKEGFPA